MGVTRGFRWTEKREEAAMQVARDELTDEVIANRVGVCRYCLQKWKRRPEFQERVAELTAAMAAAIKGKGIAELQNRVAALNERWEGMRRVIEARAVQYADVPGGDTGLLVCQVRLVKVGGRGKEGKDRKNGKEGGQMGLWDGEIESEGSGGLGVIEEYVVDVGLLRQLLEHEKQAAKELGQWNVEKQDESTVLVREYVGVSVEEV